MNERLIRIIGSIVAVIFVLDFVALSSWNESHHERPTWRSQNAYSTELTGLPELQKFVERARGLKFKERVAVELVDQRELNAARHREDELGDSGGGALTPIHEPDGGAVLGVMGLLPKSVDIDQAVGDAGVVGVYFPRQKRLLVMGREQTPFVREVLVHELTHALDDQYFNLSRTDVWLHDDEAGESFRALAEGDATSVEKQYYDSLSPADKQQADAERNVIASGGAGGPSVIGELLSYPYIGGMAFVDKLREGGGNAAVNSAFRHPPTTSEQILHPDHYLDRDVPALVSKPTPAGTPVGRGVFGVLQLSLLLSTSLDVPVIHDALEGWDGDRYVAWTESNHTCLAINVANDSPGAAEKLAAALNSWASEHPNGAAHVKGNVVEFERCA